MPVVKAQHAHVAQSAIVMDLSDLEQQAERILAEANAQAQEIVAQARLRAAAEAPKIKEDARKAGHAEGFAAGEAQGHKAGHDEAVADTQQVLQELTTRWNQLADIVEQNLPTHLADARLDLVKLALAIAERVTRQEALRNGKVVEDTVAGTLALVGAGRTVALHVNPAELATVEKYLPELLAKLRSIKAVEVKADDAITAGGCLARFGAGEIDARLETQIERIAQELLG